MVWLTFYHPFYLTSAGYLYRYMTYKRKLFKWTEEAKKAFNEIKKLLINPPVLKAPTPEGLFRLESDTSREGMGSTLLQKQGDKLVISFQKTPKISKEFWHYRTHLTRKMLYL